MADWGKKSYGRNCSAIKSWIVKLVEIVVWERERKKAYVCNFSRCCTKTIWTLELPCTTRNRSGYFSRASVDTHITYIHSFFIGYMPSSNSFTSITSAVSPLLNIFCSGQKFLNRQKREKSQNWNWKKRGLLVNERQTERKCRWLSSQVKLTWFSHRLHDSVYILLTEYLCGKIKSYISPMVLLNIPIQLAACLWDNTSCAFFICF